MPFYIVDTKETKLRTDASLTAVDPGEMKPGEVVVANRFGLFAHYALQCACPRWEGGEKNEVQALKNCYRVSFELAAKMECDRLLIPFDFAVQRGYPSETVIASAIEVFFSSMMEWKTDMTVYFGVGDESAFVLPDGMLEAVDEYIGTHRPKDYVPVRRGEVSSNRKQGSLFSTERVLKRALKSVKSEDEVDFGSYLLNRIRERGLGANEVIRGANITAKVFKKLAKSPDYSLPREAVLGLALAMKLDIPDTNILLAKAGYDQLSADDCDLVVSYCIENAMYNVMKANAILFKYGDAQLGC